MSFLKSATKKNVIWAAAALAVAWFAVEMPRAWVARAALSPSGCQGNVCTGSVTVGGQTVIYAFTEHVSANGELRIRLNGGTYSTDKLISTIVYDLPPFTAWNAIPNPLNGAVVLPAEDVNPARTGYERRDADGCAGCIVDQVLSLKFSGLAAGAYPFSLSVIQNGDTGGKSLTFYVDATAPANDSEKQTFSSDACADRIDNDLDYYPDCADPQCVGEIGEVNSGARCEQPEATCFDLFDNDADGKPDCLDSDCDGRRGDPQTPPPGKTAPVCQYGNEWASPSCPGCCTDGFNNDGDLYGNPGVPLTDCVDNAWSAVNGGDATRICWKRGSIGDSSTCPPVEMSCVDTSDSDKDKSFDQSWDMAPTTGGEIFVTDEGTLAQPPDTGYLRCLDYDCSSAPPTGTSSPNAAYCPQKENMRGASWGDLQNQSYDPDDPAQRTYFDGLCFNMDSQGMPIDDDLDGKANCADEDCLGKLNPANPKQGCFSQEFVQHEYQYCGNFNPPKPDFAPNPPPTGTTAADDDGDANDPANGGGANCTDADCKRLFGSCGPCPDREDFTYQSCADAWDNDVEGGTDCLDTDCTGKLGSISDAAVCAVTESGTLCKDGFDNDQDGKADCADTGCSGTVGPEGQICQPAGESGAVADACSDGLDNDADGIRDCADSGCWGTAPCAPQSWTVAPACVTVPLDSPPTAFTANDPTITATVRIANHVNQPDIIRLIGTATYSSVTLIIGDNTAVASFYPYAAAAPGCSLSGPSAGAFAFTAVNGHAVQIYSNPGSVNGFDITLTCATPAVPALRRVYPISLSALKSPSGVQEYGDRDFSTTLHEATLPTLTGLMPEGARAILGPGLPLVADVPYGGNLYWRAIPDDGAAPAPYSSGICRCSISLDGSTNNNTDGNCTAAIASIAQDALVTGSAVAEDGAGNVSAPPTTFAPYAVNVTPWLTTPLAITQPSQPFFNEGKPNATVRAIFSTGNTEYFGYSCDVFLRDESGNVVGGVGTSLTGLTVPGIPMINTVNCMGTVRIGKTPDPDQPTLEYLADVPEDGRYYLSIGVTDSAEVLGTVVVSGNSVSVTDPADSIESNRKAVFICNTPPDPNNPVTNGCEYADFDYDGMPEGLFSAPGFYGSEPLACDNCVGLANADQLDANANGIGDACEPDTIYGRCEVDTDLVCLYDSDDSAHCPDNMSTEFCCPGPSIKETGLCTEDPTVRCTTDAECAAAGLTDTTCAPGNKNPQLCVQAWGICSIGGNVCFEDPECVSEEAAAFLADPLPDNAGLGLCDTDADGTPEAVADGGKTCRRDDGCIDPDHLTAKCVGADFCDNLVAPWIETAHGNIYSGSEIRALAPPPQTKYNATYCITAKGLIVNFVSKQGATDCIASDQATGTTTDPSGSYSLPKSSNSYASVLGRIDLNGLRIGKYGKVENITQKGLESWLASSPAAGPGGAVLYVSGDLTISPSTVPLIFKNGSGVDGNLTVFVEGGDLIIERDLDYESGPNSRPGSLQELASVGWIVISKDGKGGNIYVDKDVTRLAGAFYMDGDQGFWSVAPQQSSDKQLTLNGLVVARKFMLLRSFKNEMMGAERFLYDGRAVVNPPPGFMDVTKSLPVFSDALTQ